MKKWSSSGRKRLGKTCAYRVIPGGSDKYDQLMADGKETEAKEHLEEKLKEIEPRAMEVLEKAQIGEDFEKLIEEYGEDPVWRTTL